jgi:hypothetical protein
MHISIFCDITPCTLLKINRRFGGSYGLHLQDIRISQTRNQHEAGGMAEGPLLATAQQVERTGFWHCSLHVINRIVRLMGPFKWAVLEEHFKKIRKKGG